MIVSSGVYIRPDLELSGIGLEANVDTEARLILGALTDSVGPLRVSVRRSRHRISSVDETSNIRGFTHLEFVYGADDGAELPGTLLLATSVVLSEEMDDKPGLVGIPGVEAPV